MDKRILPFLEDLAVLCRKHKVLLNSYEEIRAIFIELDNDPDESFDPPEYSTGEFDFELYGFPKGTAWVSVPNERREFNL